MTDEFNTMDQPTLFEGLSRLPSDRLEETAAFIKTLVARRCEQRNAMIDATAGSFGNTLGKKLGDALADCERIDESTW